MSSTDAVPMRSVAPTRHWPTVLIAVSLIGVLFARNGIAAETAVDAFVIAVLVVISRIDIERRIIPDRIVLPASAIALVANIAIDPEHWWHWLVAWLGCGFLFLVFARLSNGGLGMGDVKLAAFLGAALGGDVLIALIIGASIGAVYSIGIILRHGAEGRKRTLPYGPFLAAGAITALIFL